MHRDDAKEHRHNILKLGSLVEQFEWSENPTTSFSRDRTQMSTVIITRIGSFKPI